MKKQKNWRLRYCDSPNLRTRCHWKWDTTSRSRFFMVSPSPKMSNSHQFTTSEVLVLSKWDSTVQDPATLANSGCAPLPFQMFQGVYFRVCRSKGPLWAIVLTCRESPWRCLAQGFVPATRNIRTEFSRVQSLTCSRGALLDMSWNTAWQEWHPAETFVWSQGKHDSNQPTLALWLESADRLMFYLCMMQTRQHLLQQHGDVGRIIQLLLVQ